MGASGSNELNALLKAKVVKLRAELDVTGSLPKLKEQIDEISKKLENKPVKLKVNFDLNVKDFNTQITSLYKKLNDSKTAKTSMKLQVEIDVNGSATKIKSQLQDIYKTVGDFNKKYGEQMKQMENSMNNSMKGDGSGKIISPILDTRALATSVEEAKKYMNELFGNGLFSSQELKNAQGELLGFVGTLTKANGVIEKIKYEWDKDKGSFVPISAQTLTQTEQTVHKAQQLLTSLYNDIEKLKNGQGKVNLSADYSALEKEKELNMDMVLTLQNKIKAEQVLQAQIKAENELYRQQQQLIAQITREQSKVSSKNPALVTSMGDLKSQIGSLDLSNEYSPSMLKDLKQQFQEMKMDYQGAVSQEKDLYNAEKKRLDIIAQIERLQRTNVLNSNSGSAMSKEYVDETRALANEIKTMDDYIVVKQRMDAINREVKSVNLDSQIEAQLERLKIAMQNYATATGKSQSVIETRFQQVKDSIGQNLELATGEVQRWENMLKSFNANLALEQRRNSIVDNANNDKLMKLVSENDIEGLRKYISELRNADVAMVKMSTDAKGFTRIQATMASTGKTAQELAYEIDTVDQRLRQVGTRDVFNANRNLGAFEQLRIAMERVPVWTIAMTAWYGTIRFVKEMTDQIIELDTSLTELKRVANANLNIDILFKGAVDLSKQLGNNVMDVLGSVNELARTFGDFNERQLLAITKTATLMSNVSDLSAEQATQDLVGTMNAFNISAEDSIHIVDALNQVDNDYAISTQQLAEGLSKSASTAKTFGVTMEETVGYITAIGAVTMESGNIIGNSLKTIFSRISTVKQAYTSLQSVGVAVWDAQTGAVRPVDKVLADLAVRWRDLSAEQQQSIAVNVAGRYQLSRFLALMNNWQMSTDATNTALHSQGSAMRENEKYLNSFGAKINQLKSGFTELASAVGNAVLSAGIMAVITALTNMAQAGVHVAQTIGVLPAVLLPVVLVLGKMGILGSIAKSFGALPEKVTAVKEAFTLLTGATRIFQATYNTALASSDTTGRLQAMAMGWRAVQISEEGATLATVEWGIKAKSALIETGIGAIIVGIGFAIEGVMNAWNKYKQKQDEIQQLNDKMVTSYRTHADGMTSLVAKYDELNSKTNRTTSEQTDYLNVTKQLASEIPTAVAYIDANGQAHLKNTNEIKAEIDNVKKLSQANAELTNAKFLDDLEKQSKAFMKIQNNIDSLNAKQKELIDNNGKSAIGIDGLFTENNTKAIAENKVQVMMAEADKSKAIQETIKNINDQATAYLDAKGKLGELGDQQTSTMEKFVSQNESMLRFAKTSDEYKQAYQDLFNVSTQVGDVWTQAFEKMSKGMGDNTEALSNLKNDLGDVAKSIPNTFFQMTDAMGRPTKSIDQITNGLKEIINVSNRVAQGDGNWNGLVNSLQKAGLSADQAKQMLDNLARTHDNAKLRAEAQAQGVDGLTASMDSLNQETLKALDLTQELFGYNKDDLGAIKTRIQAMHLMIDTEGQGAKSSEAYQQAQKDLGDMLGMSASELDKNKNRIFDVADALDKLDLTQYKATDSWSEFVKSNKDLSNSQKDLLIQWAKTKGAKDIITGANVQIVKSNTEVKKSVQQVNDVFAVKPDNQIKKAFEETKKSAPDKSWFQKVGDGFRGFGDWLGKFIPPSFAKDVSNALSTVGKFFSDLGTKIKDFWVTAGRDINNSLGGMPSKIGTTVGQWAVAFGKALDRIGISTADFFKKLPRNINDAIKGMGNIWHNVVSYMDNLPDQTRPKLEAWYVSMKEWFATAPKRLAHEMGTWYIAIWDFFHMLKTETPKKLDEWWTAIQAWFEAMPSRFKRQMSTWWSEISKWFEDTRLKIKGKLDEWETEFMDWFDSLPSKIGKAMLKWGTEIANQVGEWKTSFHKKLDEWWNDFRDWIQSVPSKIRTQLQTWHKEWDKFLADQKAENKRQFGEWGKDIGNWFTKQNEENMKQFGKWGDDIKKSFSKMGNNIYNEMAGWFKSIPPLNTWGDKIKGELNKVGSNIGKWFKEHATTIGDGISGWFKSIPNTPLVKNIQKELDKMKKAVSKWFTDNGNTLYDNLAKMFKSIPPLNTWGDGIKKSLSKEWGKVTKWWDDEKNTIAKNWSKNFKMPDTSKWGDDIRKWLDGMGTSISNWFENTKKTWSKGLDGWWQGVREWFLGLGKKKEVKDSGKNILDGMQKGVDDNKNQEIDKLGKTIVDILTKVLEALGILLLATGRELLKRLIKGVQQGASDWQKAWDDMKQKAVDKVVKTGDDAEKEAKQLPSKMAKGIQDKISDWEKSWDDIKKKASDKMEATKKAVQDYASQLPKAISDGIKQNIGDLEDGMKSVANKLASGIEGKVNWVIGGLDSVLDYMDVPKEKQIPKIKLPRFAKGTDSQGHMGGQALVGEEGRELAYIPNVGYTMLGENGAEILDLPKGTSVLPNKQTEIMLQQYGFPAYADGTGWLKDAWGNISSTASNTWNGISSTASDIWGGISSTANKAWGSISKIGELFVKYLQNPKELLNAVLSLVPMPSIGGNGVLTDVATSGVSKIKDEAVNFLSGQMKDFMNVASGAGASGAVTGWLTTAMKLTGVPMSWLSPLASLVQNESGGNPHAINLWDSNAKAGHPSKGLFQTIDSTFNSYAMQGLGDIYNPIANAVAGIRYIIDRYGSIFNTPGIKSMMGGGGYRGYANGGLITQKELAWHGEEGAEMIIPLISSRRQRGLDLWKLAGEQLGISPKAVDWLVQYLNRTGQGGQASGGSGSMGASSGDGGGEGSGANSGTSGTIVPSMPSLVGSVNMDGNYFVTATDIATPYTIDNFGRSSTTISGETSQLQAEMDGVNKSTVQYRDLLKQIIALNNQNLSLEKQQLAYYSQRLASINLRLTQLPAVNKQNQAQRDEYNALQQEYDNDLQKYEQLKGDIQTQMNDIHNKSVEMWTDFVNEIVSKYDDALAGIKQKTDNIDFSINVSKAVNPNDYQGLLNTQEQKAQTLQQAVATNNNKWWDLHTQYEFAVQRKQSPEEIKAVKDAMDKANTDWQQSVQELLQAEQDIKDTRTQVADAGISQLKDYYTKMKDMATNAIATEKEELQKEHDAKMQMYSDETNAINAIYDAKTKQIDQTQSDNQYASDLATKTQAVADLQNKIALLSRNTDLESKGKVVDLKTQLQQAQKDLSDLQNQHQVDQMKTALDNQKQAQLDAITSQSNAEDKNFTAQNNALDAESTAISKQYDDLINNDKKWADMRNQAISGNFQSITTELQKMTDNINNMNKGIFDNLTQSFSTYSDAVKQQIADTNALTVQNMNTDYSQTTANVNSASKANGYVMTDGSVPNGGTKVTVPNVTTPPPPPPKPAPAKPAPKPTPTPAKPASQPHGWKTTSALQFHSTAGYGNNVIGTIPQGATVEYDGMVNGWAKVKWNNRIGYVGKRYLQQFDTGGYTGDWGDNGGRLAVLHKKELVLNEKQTADILNTAKIMDKVKGIIPKLILPNVNDKIAMASNVTTNITYGDINITVEGGDKKKAKDIAKELLDGMKKKGK